MRGIIKWSAAAVCEISFWSNGETTKVGGEEEIHGGISGDSHWEAEDEKKENFSFALSFIIKMNHVTENCREAYSILQLSIEAMGFWNGGILFQSLVPVKLAVLRVR